MLHKRVIYKGIAILNMYVPNDRAPKYMKQNWQPPKAK